MAVTGFWPIRAKLNAAIEYVRNPEKTADLDKALHYAANEVKTERCMYVAGINCSKYNAYEQMTAVKRKFGERGKNIAYHGIQSFAVGEVTPEEAFEIGKLTARRMWGDKYQVIVTTHLNTENLHNHFIVNSISFKDGTKYRNKIGDHMELRRISDEICRERRLSVLEGSEFYSKGKKKEYWLQKSGKKTHSELLRHDIEYCLRYASNWPEFKSQLWSLGYEIDYTRMSVRAKGWERSRRLSTLGYTVEAIQERLDANRDNPYFYSYEWNTHLPYKPRQFPLEYELRRLGFTIEHTNDTATVLVDTILLLIITVIMIAQEMADVMLLSPELRHAAKDIQSFVEDYHFLQSNNIQTDAELAESIKADQAALAGLERQRDKLSNKIRRPKSLQELEENKAQRKEVSKQMTPLRKKIKHAERILEQSPHLEELLRHEHELEKRAMNSYRERER